MYKIRELTQFCSYLVLLKFSGNSYLLLHLNYSVDNLIVECKAIKTLLAIKK